MPRARSTDSPVSDAQRPILCLVTDLGADSMNRLAAIRAALAGGVDWIQLRDRSVEGGALLSFADQIIAALEGAGRAANAALWINRRADVALACRAAGVHVGFDGPPLSALAGLELAAGVSAHSAGEVRSAAEAGAAYAHLAPIYPPLSKPSGRPALGPESLAEACRGGFPVFAQGGIQANRIAEVRAAGARGVAVTGAILSAPDPGDAAGALRRALDRADVA